MLRTSRVPLWVGVFIIAALTGQAVFSQKPVPKAPAAPKPPAATKPKPPTPPKPATTPAPAATPETPPAAEGATLDEQLHAVTEEFVAIYNAHDAEKLAALFTADADVVTPEGTRLSGTEELIVAFSTVFTENPYVQASLEIESSRAVTKDVALEEGIFTRFADGEEPSSISYYSLTFVRQEDGWKIASARTLRDEVISPYEHLRDLEWMVGDWVDEGKDGLVHTTYRWSETRSFMICDFEFRTRGTAVLKGSQFIGWDPRMHRIRSWSFDSEGGVMESTWVPVEEGWMITSTGFNASGTDGRFTRLLILDSEDRCHILLRDRVVGIERPEDIAFTMVRRPPAPEADNPETDTPAEPAAEPATDPAADPAAEKPEEPTTEKPTTEKPEEPATEKPEESAAEKPEK